MQKILSLLLVSVPLFTMGQIKYIDKANMDLSVKPADNFYQYANGGWLKNTVMPGTKTRWGSFDMLREEASQHLKILLEEATKKKDRTRPEQMSGDFYTSGMDSLQLEKLGTVPVQKDLASIDAIANINDLVALQLKLRKEGAAGGLFSAFVSQDAKDINVYRVSMGQGGTTLPDRDYYLKDDARSVAIRGALKTYISKLFTFTGVSTADAAIYADNILKAETAIAKAQLSRVEMRDPQKRYNKFTPEEFSASLTVLTVPAIFTALDIPKQDFIIVSTPTFFRALDSLLTSLPLDTWKQLAKFEVLKSAAPYLSNNFVTANFEYQKVISGQKEITPRWQRTASLIDGSIGDMLGQLYVARYFKPEAKQRMLDMVNNLQQTFASRIKSLSWMSEETKSKALIKLMAITKKIAYPDKWKEYEGVVISKDAFLQNVRNASKWSYNYNISKLGQPINRNEFNFTTPTVNASYNSIQNTITFPAGILQFPFFDFGADDAVNYGGIVAVIGHEMTHGFDDQGRQSDADGSLRDWWTKEDADKFKVLADAVTKQYDAAVVLDSLHVNGKLTLGENLADFGGLAMAYEAFKKTPQGKSNKKIDGFTPDQRFFLSWAQVWRGIALPETAANLLLTDPHSPAQYRALIPPQQMQEFYDAFGIKEGDKMWLPVEKRVHVW
ncbi:M13 family metallopeptidase [Ferruginibacter sp. SUN106]|uniref:M13 family metallopeptidase n=1 Tax=Ferruginibacter sp. SUN106 TaxID=2978348 RepID=UPI003D361F3C